MFTSHAHFGCTAARCLGAQYDKVFFFFVAAVCRGDRAMATAYHLEVLRKQRVIDRAEKARKRLEETENVRVLSHYRYKYVTMEYMYTACICTCCSSL